MKKIFSLALVAMMAMCAMVVTSCGSDDEEETTPSTFEFSLRITTVGAVNNGKADATAAIKSYITKLVSGISGVTVSADAVISGSSSIQDKVISALKNANYDELDKTLATITDLTTITFEVHNAHSTDVVYTSHTYKKAASTFDTSVVVGAWKASTDAGEYTLTVTSEKTTGSISIYDYYVATATTPDGQEIPGALGVSKSKGTGQFDSTEKDVLSIMLKGYENDDHTAFTSTIYSGNKAVANSVTFTKQ